MGRKLCVLMLLFAATLSGCLKESDSLEDDPLSFSIGGMVTKSDGGAALGASVVLVRISDGSNAGVSMTNATGEYVITGLSVGSYKIEVKLSGYETATTAEIKLTDNNITVEAIVLQKLNVPTYTVGGSVSLPDGSAAAGAAVEIRRSSDNTMAGQPVTTDASGAYLLNGIPEGEYTLVISLEGYETGILSPLMVTTGNLTGQNIILQTITIDVNAVSIVFEGNDATIRNLPSDGSITVTKEGADVTIATSSTKCVEYVVSGATSGGSLKIQNNVSAPNTIRLTLNNAVIASSSKLPPVQITKNEGVTIVELKGNNILSDNASNEENATLITKSGSLEFEGYGKLNISGVAKHAISSGKKSITVREGNIYVILAASDGLHADDGFVISGGSLDITAYGDGIDAGIGTAVVNGGSIRINSSADDTKGIKADAGITVVGGRIEMNIAGAQSKGIGSKSDITINNGDISIVTSGRTILEATDKGYNPSYCTAIKSSKNITVTGGNIRIESRRTADGGKGLSADGNIVIQGGTLNITTAGDGKTYTTEAGTTDAYTANCIRSNQNISLLGGNITCSSSGAGGKGINADGTITIGVSNANNADLTLAVTTTGERFLVSGSSGGGQAGRPGGGGGFGGNSTNYANPKAVKSTGNMTVNAGNILIMTEKNGAEGFESKQTLAINGGTIAINAYDDAINASKNITINGGEMYFYSIGNDAIDSNGTLTITGGLIVASGTNSPECAFDCDNNTFKITGGTAIGVGGSTSSPTSNACTQRVLVWGASGFTAGQMISIKSSGGSEILTFKLPRTYSGNMTLVFTSPSLQANTAYTIYKGSNVTGGSNFYGLYSDAVSSGGTSSATFTTSSMVTTVGSGNSGGGGPGGRP